MKQGGGRSSVVRLEGLNITNTQNWTVIPLGVNALKSTEYNEMLFGNEMLLGNGVVAIRNHKIATLVMGYNALILVELKGIQGLPQLPQLMIRIKRMLTTSDANVRIRYTNGYSVISR